MMPASMYVFPAPMVCSHLLMMLLRCLQGCIHEAVLEDLLTQAYANEAKASRAKMMHPIIFSVSVQ